MKTSIVMIAALICAVSASSASAQISRGIVKEGLTVDSKILGKPVRYTIYLPSDYETSNRKYPVVYLLHGYTDNDTGWLQFGEANQIADEAIARRDIPPMIIVMPDGGVSWYINNHDGTVKYEDFFFKEFIPAIESQYRIRAEKAYRGVAGLSMGGHGALVYALRHPDMFAACVPFSAAIFTDEEVIANPDQNWARTFGPVYGANLKGQDRINDHLKS
ncbi:MAG: alpha/beta hydrolase-fold protein, partial [Blastocatellia bacterium]